MSHHGVVPRRWPVALGAFGLALALCGGAVLLVDAQGLARADMYASIASVMVGLAGIAVAIWLGRERLPAEEELLHRAAGRLARLVSRQWEDETGVRGLRDPRPISLRWSSTGRPVSAPADSVLGSQDAVAGRPLRLKLAGDLTKVADMVRRLPARQLVVLGDPGAGKSVLAILFVLAELARRGPADAVPVLLPLAGWNPRQEHLHTWLARRLEVEYPGLRDADAYGPQAALRLVRDNRILPVLDGLDEMPAALIPSAIAALNRAVGAAGLVVTCRSVDYEAAIGWAGTALSRAAVIEIEPVGPASALAFLTGSEPAGSYRWDPVAAHLRRYPQGNLAKTLSNPLMITIVRSVCAPGSGTDPAELPELARRSDSPELLGGALMARVVPTVYSDQPPVSHGASREQQGRRLAPLGTPPRRPGRPRYRPERVTAWLAFLANHLRYRLGGSPDLAWWQLAASVPRAGIGAVAGVGAGLFTASLLVALSLHSDELRSELTRGLGGVVVSFALVVGLVVGLTAARNAGAARGLPHRRDRMAQVGQALRDVCVVVAVSAPVFIATATDSSRGVWQDFGFVILVSAAVLAGIASGLRRADSTAPRQWSLRPRRLLGRDVVTRLVVGFLAGVAVGMPFAADWASDSGFGGTPGSRVLLTLIGAGGVGIAAIGVPLALGRLMQSVVDEESAVTPHSVLRNDRTAFTAVCVGVGLVLGAPVTGLLAADSSGAINVIDSALVYGAAVVVSLGLVTATAAVPSQVCYQAARIWLAARGRLPWRLMRFLGDAHNREILRQAGSVYQFRHALLQDHFARQRPYAGAPVAVPRHSPWRRDRAPEKRDASVPASELPASTSDLSAPTPEPISPGRPAGTTPGPLRTWAGRLAAALPVLLLVVATWAGVDKSQDRLIGDAAEKVAQDAVQLRDRDPITALRLLHASVSLQPTNSWAREALQAAALLQGIQAPVSIVAASTRRLVISRHGERLATVDTNGRATLWRIDPQGAVRNPVPMPGDPFIPVAAANFAPAGDFLATLHAGGAVTVWRLAGDAPSEAGRISTSEATVDVGIDGDIVTTIDQDATVRRWHWRTGAPAARPNRPRGEPPGGQKRWLRLSDDGRRALERPGPDTELVVWPTDEAATTAPRTLADSDDAWAASLSGSTGQAAVVGSSLRVYDAEGQRLFTFDDRWGSVRDIAIGTGRIAVLHRDSVLLLETDKLRETAAKVDADLSRYVCTIVGRGLSEEEWARHVPYSWLPAHAYRPTCH
ncbi:hypothetical protein E1258_05355 [Micromonospora sp. KC207]|uniref:hypothetical protein n=1 Tax=Micromonospora sp. KC207 TaxID=2530377 RepID=UPI001042950E|nr:hypothetical protein [Micromonospora sp. KC207]TDC65497.1 hypothetical protein E1258_05355 [Micromonospora sp. KC207]